MPRFLLLLALAAGLAACDAALSPYDGTDDGFNSTIDRMGGTWLYPSYAWSGRDDVYLDMQRDGSSRLRATTSQHYAAASCRENDVYTEQFDALSDSTFTNTVTYNGQVRNTETVGVRVSDVQLRFLRSYVDGNGTVVRYQNSLGRAPATAASIPACPFRTMGNYRATAINNLPLPQSYTATDSLGVLRTYRMSQASLSVSIGYAGIGVSQAIVTGSTVGPARNESGGSLRTVAAGGAWTAALNARAMPGLRLSTTGASNSTVQSVRFQRAGMAAPITITFSQDFSRPAATGESPALDALRRPQADPVSL